MLVNVECKSSIMRKTSSQRIVEQINLNEPLHISNDADLENAFHFWQGASGKRYIHSVYTLFTCPELPKANYVLVKRDENDECTALSIGQTTADANSLNLAFLRQSAAKFGANEIHVNVMTKNDHERNLVRLDLLGCQSINGQNPKH
ncbi:MAG: hypothetical protein JJ964_04960 [Rhizobiales bacterium]|nr:hypothetical protein [Hyphomicrobiales bacterium]